MSEQTKSKTPLSDALSTFLVEQFPATLGNLELHRRLTELGRVEIELGEAKARYEKQCEGTMSRAGEIVSLRQQLTTALAEIAELRKIVVQHREGVARFLVPWRGSLDKSWLDHFVKECGVEFDAIGFVKATPLAAIEKGTKP